MKPLLFLSFILLAGCSSPQPQPARTQTCWGLLQLLRQGDQTYTFILPSPIIAEKLHD